jgi:hypothetical protein
MSLVKWIVKECIIHFLTLMDVKSSWGLLGVSVGFRNSLAQTGNPALMVLTLKIGKV